MKRKKEEEEIISVYFNLGMKFRCSVLIAPVKTESCDIILYILEFTESNDRNRQRRMRMFFLPPQKQHKILNPI